MDDFYLVLASNGAAKTYPDNTANHFYNPLAHSIQLPGKWTVALQEITYENSINTVVDEKIRIITSPPPVEEYFQMEEYKIRKKKDRYLDIVKSSQDKVNQIYHRREIIKKAGWGYPLKIERVPLKEGEKEKEKSTLK